MKTLYRELINTAENAGIKIISDEHCCKLLAWLYAFGGENEAVIANVKLRENILISQKRLCINGGEIPNQKLFPLLRKYILELEPFVQHPDRSFIHPLWVFEICDYYDLREPKARSN